MIKCILYPKCKLFVSAGGKAQAAGIIEEKVREICTMFPGFEKEIDYSPRTSQFTKDYVKIQFKNGSYFDNLVANEKTRGKRRHGGSLEECVSIDGEILSKVLIPVMNVSRSCVDGTMHPEEPLNKSQLYITTAGYKDTFAGFIEIIGEVKLREPRNEGVVYYRLLTVKAYIICNAVPSHINIYGRFRDYPLWSKYLVKL